MPISGGNHNCKLHTTQYSAASNPELILELSEIDSVIFDLDGTLIDSAQQITNALNLTSDFFGENRVSLGQVKSLIGKPLHEILVTLNLGVLLREQFIKKFRENLKKSIDLDNLAFPYVAELLQSIKRQGKSVGIATSKPSELAKSVVENSILNGQINFVQGTDNSLHKPHPHVIEQCMKRLGSNKALMIGDRREDLAAANAAGIKSIGIAQSSHSKNDLWLEKPLLVVDSIQDLLTLFNHMVKLSHIQQEDSKI